MIYLLFDIAEVCRDVIYHCSPEEDVCKVSASFEEVLSLA